MRTRLFFFSLFCAVLAILYVISPIGSFPANVLAQQNPGTATTPTPSPSPPRRGDGIGAGQGEFGQPNGGRMAPLDPANPIFRTNEVTRKARITSKPVPEYTLAARANCLSGTVRLVAVFRADGTVTNIRPLNQLPYGLTESAILAARNIHFEPAQKDGKKVAQYLTIEYNFSIYLDEGDPGLKTPAVIIERPEPVYTEAARQHRTRGKVVLLLMLAPDGRVEVTKTETGLADGLTEAAIEAAKKIKFSPAVAEGGCVVAQSYRIEYSFAP